MEQRKEQAIHKLIEEGLFFRINKSKLARHFLKDVLEINVFQLSTDEVSKEICKKYNYTLEELPKEKEELFKFVAEDIMGIDADLEPYQVFNSEVLQVMDDLKKINSMIQEYEKMQQVKDIDRYERTKYQYLVEKLNKAKNEVCDYMAENIKSYVYRKMKSKKKQYKDILFSNIFYDITDLPYPFRGNEKEYKITVFAGLDYKFNHMTIMENLELKSNYIHDKKKFHDLVDIYINSNDFCNDILSIIEGNHILNKRVMIKKAIDVYIEGRMELFCQIIPLQIEGLIYDYCIELGISPSKIDRVPFDKKLEELVAIDKNFKCHEYFMYDFIELRNTAAHGRLHDDMNYKDTANMLILDLLYLCKFVNSSSATAVNRMIKLVKEIERENTLNDEWDAEYKVLEFINEYRKERLPTFYDTNKEIQKIVEYAHSEDFIKYIKLNVMYPAHLTQGQKDNIRDILIYLKKSPELKEECTYLLKELSKNANYQE
ncbi:hypothetical protein P4V71_25935 [Bacillus thuringiensis]|uniref:Uncharacterized protein n=1 Tax=Bacillus thuringiensis TaxID=1428 RepID=A0A9X6VA19_BACTU|nr:hypothetical protein [Bacillus thuringiensis]KIP26660.1 hypothetical protein BG10_1807 [Bacillus thuringiensis serovar morrisoni]MBG9640171.1 hypothetical protein [Bacillus thuringiensis]MBG9675861.1 hypothetical protein [Bacillus thuringiensis]MCT6947630.1 hypothetical protein [Bacillus thuringiensis]MDR5024445.1 hypothetical protein [Bacillus thuringiensis]